MKEKEKDEGSLLHCVCSSQDRSREERCVARWERREEERESAIIGERED